MTNLTASRLPRIFEATSHAAEIQYQIMRYATGIIANSGKESKDAIEIFNEIMKCMQELRLFMQAMQEIREAEVHGFESLYSYQMEKKERESKGIKTVAEILEPDEAI